MKSAAFAGLFALVGALAPLASAQVVYSVSTVAGVTGAAGYADGSGASVRFNSPAAVAVDGSGNIFVGETNNAKLRKIAPDGAVTTVATLANGTAGLAVDAAGNVYIADAVGQVIRRVASDGSASIVAGQAGTPGSADGTGDAARFNGPQGIARDAAGNLFVSDGSNHTIRKITPAGVVTTLAGLAGVSGNTDGAGPLARFSSPVGIAVDTSGNVYVADGARTIRKISAAGEVSTLAGTYNYSGSTDGIGGAARFSQLKGLTINAAGTLFVSDSGNYTVRQITSAGVVTTIAGQAGYSGSTDGTGAGVRFSSLQGIAVDAAGNFIVADSGTHTIRKGTYIPPPAISSQPGNATVSPAQNATFSVTASGGGTLTYQWQRQAVGVPGFVSLGDSATYSGTTTATLTVSAATTAMTGDQFRCVVGGDAGTVTSTAAGLTVALAPVLTSAASATFYAGQPGTFTFSATGSPAPTFSVTAGTLPAWASLNATTGVLSGTPPNTAGSPYAFTITATNSTATANQAFTLTVQAAPIPPVVSVSTPRQVVAKGGTVTLSVSILAGTGTMNYQWKRNGLPIPGATAATHTITGATARDSGYYQAVVSNAGGSATAVIFVAVSYTTTEVVAWGGSTAVPAGLNRVVAVAAGGNHNLALKADGTVVGWGTNDYGQITIPGDLSGVVAIAAGSIHSLALKSDGTVVAWGYNGNGQTAVPAGLSGVVGIAAGNNHSVALKSDGTVVAWGYNGNGQAAVPAGLSGVVAVAAGNNSSLALKADGTVVSWGYNYGTVPSTLVGALAIASGDSGSIAVKADGTVVYWGYSSYGQSNVPPGLSGVVSAGVTYYQAVALKSDGTLVVWGSDSGSVLPPTNLRSIVAISAGSGQRLALRDASNDLAPTITASPTGVAANIGQAATFSAAATAGTAVINYQWFKDGSAISGATAASYTIGGVTAASAGGYYVVASNALGSATSTTAILSVNAAPVVSATTGGRYPLVVGQSLTLTLASSISSSATVQWRRNGVAISGATGRSYAIGNAALNQGGYYQALYNDGSGAVLSAAIFVPVVPAATQVLAWGNPGYSTDTTMPPAGLTNVVAIAARGSTTLAVKADGTVVRWGNYSYTVPADLANIVAVAVGSSHYLALRADGTVTTWSDNSYSPPPAVPDGLTNVVAVAAGTYHSLALKGDGTVVAWGSANYGATAVPAGLSDVVGIAAGDAFSLALRADGTVVGWGNSGYGQSAVPAGLSGVTAIAAGTNFSVALKSDGTVIAWGYNGSGQTTVPAGLSDVVAVAAGDAHGLALKTDGTVTAWGYNSSAQTTPPAGLRNVVGMAAGNYHSVVVRDASRDTAPVIATQPAGGTAFTGQSVMFKVQAGAGTAPLAYQWRKAGAVIAGATNASLVVPTVTPAQAGSYDVVISNYLGSVISQPAVLAVNATAAVGTTPTGRRALVAGDTLILNGSTSIPGPVTYQWRRNGQPIAGATSTTHVITSATWASGGVYQFVATNSLGAATSAPIFISVATGAQLRAWGDNGSGQTTVPAGLTNLVGIAAGYDHSLALKSDGTVVAWGANSNNQCNIPAGLADVAAIAAGSYFSMALQGNGTVVTWGRVNYTPTEVGTALAIASDPNSGLAMALRTDGTVIAWDSSGVRTDVPAGLGDVVAIASGGNYRMALKADGTVVQWGGYSSLVPPAGLTNVVAIASGNSHLLALKADGTVVAWGSNYNSETSVPPGLSGVVAIAAGNYVSYALKADGTVVTWGTGNSTLASGAVALAPAFALRSGYNHALGLRDPSGDVAPTITVQPVNQTATAGQTVTLTVTATSTPPPTYQWYRNGIAIYNGTTATLTLNYVNTGDTAKYTVTVSNALGSTTSAEVTLTVNPALNQRGLLTSSARAETGAAIAGTFTIEGSSAKQVLVRAVGPALTAFGMTGVLADPQLTIATPGGVVVDTNDDWSNATNASQISYVSAQVGAFALSAGSKDAAVLRSFAPGTYHVRVTGAGNSAGVAMLEVYDADSASRTVYVATNAFAGTGGKVFVQGFLLAGVPAGRSYLIRALGPSLGAGAALADPQLAVFDSKGVQVAANDNWGGDAALASLAASVGAMPLATASKDAAVNFVPSGAGAYTVQVSDVTGASGTVLVEIFEVDAQRATSIPAAIVAQPQSVTVLPGSAVTLGVATIGRPAPTVQWRKNGVAIGGATNAILTLANVQAADAGGYTVVVTNAGGTATSSVATLGIATQLATQAIVGPGYVAGSTVTISNTFGYSGTASSLGWQVTLPAGWSYAAGAGSEGDVKPAAGATGTLEWAWTTPPASPVAFTYTLNVPAGETAVRELTATAIMQVAGSPQTTAVAPNPLGIGPAPAFHSADTNGDGKIGLPELLRVIELYNTRNGTVRTGAYAVDAANLEDGFAADAARLNTAVVALARYHSADTSRDGKLGLNELLRMIELYNTRSGTVRTGEYHVQAGAEDGFGTGP